VRTSDGSDLGLGLGLGLKHDTTHRRKGSDREMMYILYRLYVVLGHLKIELEL